MRCICPKVISQIQPWAAAGCEEQQVALVLHSRSLEDGFTLFWEKSWPTVTGISWLLQGSHIQLNCPCMQRACTSSHGSAACQMLTTEICLVPSHAKCNPQAGAALSYSSWPTFLTCVHRGKGRQGSWINRLSCSKNPACFKSSCCPLPLKWVCGGWVSSQIVFSRSLKTGLYSKSSQSPNLSQSVTSIGILCWD